MKMRLNGSAIRDHASFHRECQRVLGFPDFYGQNWNAWIDCMSDIDDPSTGMSAIHVGVGEPLEIELTETRELWQRCPEVVQALAECTAAVNERFGASGRGTRICLTFLESGR